MRRLALAAMCVLSKDSPGIVSGLKDRKIWKRLEDSELGVRQHAVRTLAVMVRS